MTDLINIDDMVETLSNKEHLTVTFRAFQQLGIPVEWDLHEETGDPKLIVLSEGDGELEDYLQDDAFIEAVEHQYKLLVIKKIFGQMQDDGLLKAAGVDEDGMIEYAVLAEAA